MASTSLTEFYPSYGLKPCRVILERVPAELDPVQNPRTVKPPRQTPQIRIKAFKAYKYGLKESPFLQKKPSKASSKASAGSQNLPGYSGKKDATSKAPTQEDLGDVITTCQPPEVTKTRKRRHSQAKRDIPEKLQACTPSLQASTQLEELVGSHVDDGKKEKEAGEEVTASAQASDICTEERGGASGNGSRNEHSLTPASQVGTSLEEFYTERVDDSGKRRAAGEASTMHTPRKVRRSCSKWKHGVIKRRRPCRKLGFTPPAPSVWINHSEELLVDPANERGVATISLDEAIVDQDAMLVPIGEEQRAVISGEVVESPPCNELYRERQDLPRKAQPPKARRKRGRQRKSVLTAPKRRGRPPKNPAAQPAQPRKRGRPRKDASTALPAKKPPLQALEVKGRRGRRPKPAPAPSAAKRRPGRPRKERIVASIDPCDPDQDCAVFPGQAAAQDCNGDDSVNSGCSTTSNVSSLPPLMWSYYDQLNEPSNNDRPARKRKPRKRRVARKKAVGEAQPARKRGRPRKNPSEGPSGSKGTASWTPANFQGDSLPYDPEEEAADAESDWETCSNVSVTTMDTNLHDMLLPGAELDCPGRGVPDLEECRQLSNSYTTWGDNPDDVSPWCSERGISADAELWFPGLSDEDVDVAAQELEAEADNGEEGSTASAGAQRLLQSCLSDSEVAVDNMSDFEVCSHTSSMYCEWNTDAWSVSSCRGAETDVSGTEMSYVDTSRVIIQDWTDFDSMLATDSESVDSNDGASQATRARTYSEEPMEVERAMQRLMELDIVPDHGFSSSEDAGLLLRNEPGTCDTNRFEDFPTRQVSGSEEDVRSTRRKRGRPRKKRLPYVDTRPRRSHTDEDDYRPTGKEPVSEPGPSEVNAAQPVAEQRRRGRPRKKPLLTPEIIDALTRDSESDFDAAYDAEKEPSSEEEEERELDETSQVSEAEARRRHVQRNLRIAPFKILDGPPKRRRGYKRRGRSDWDPDFELPDPFEQEPADESPDEGNYTFRQDIMPSQKDSQIEEVDELSCLESSSENVLLDTPQVSTAYSAMECKEAGRDELYCDECKVDHPGECPVHGPLIYIKDTHVPKGTPLRANKTLPEGLDIRRSAMRGAQFGVFAMKPLAKRTCFGPYEGVRRKTNRGNGYTWKVYGRNGEAYMVDARPLDQSNWMRYVNCSLTEDEQNMVAFQRNGNIYYRTRRDIAACEELVVWYGNSFAKDLGLIDYKGQSSEPKTPDPNRRPIFKCGSCNDAFSMRKCLLSHKLRHHVKKPAGRFECRLCPYNCKTRWAIKRHVLTHTKHKPFTCRDCGKSFTQRSSLKTHLRIHTGERPFECATCGQRFREPAVLSRHQRLHTGHSKVHACPECGRSFSLKSDVQRHLRTHTGDRPYSCTICKKSFRDVGHWRRHERLVHKKEYNLKCPFCGKGEAAMWNLRQHVRAHHTPRKREDESSDAENGEVSSDNVKPGSDDAEVVTEGTKVEAQTGEAVTGDGEPATVDRDVATKSGEAVAKGTKVQLDV